MGAHGNGRPRAGDKFQTLFEYLNGYVFVIKDSLILMKDDEHKKEKIFLAASGRRRLQEDKLELAYKGLERFRK